MRGLARRRLRKELKARGINPEAGQYRMPADVRSAIEAAIRRLEVLEKQEEARWQAQRAAQMREGP